MRISQKRFVNFQIHLKQKNIKIAFREKKSFFDVIQRPACISVFRVDRPHWTPKTRKT